MGLNQTGRNHKNGRQRRDTRRRVNYETILVPVSGCDNENHQESFSVVLPQSVARAMRVLFGGLGSVEQMEMFLTAAFRPGPPLWPEKITKIKRSLRNGNGGLPIFPMVGLSPRMGRHHCGNTVLRLPKGIHWAYHMVFGRLSIDQARLFVSLLFSKEGRWTCKRLQRLRQKAELSWVDRLNSRKSKRFLEILSEVA